MPGRLFLTHDLDAIAADFGQTWPASEPRMNIAPGEDVVALGPDGFQSYRWGIIPVGRTNARGRPVLETLINARSETVFEKSAYDGVGRAVLPVSGWYEWTGEARRKTAWQISAISDDPIYFAAITDVWSAPGGATLHQLATVTCAPNNDLRDIHHRMGVLLRREDIATWIEGSQEDVVPLMQPWPDGLLRIEKADPKHFA